jgi:hypothetical protein
VVGTSAGALEHEALARFDVALSAGMLRYLRHLHIYTTAAVMPEDGTIRFAEDIYRHDARLDRALAKRGS